jgi:uncharacterized membrane protein
MNAIKRLHRFAGLQGLYAVSILSVVGLSLVGARMHYTEGDGFAFLAFNLMLAWVPYVISTLGMALCGRRRGWLLLAMLPAWLLFFPNAPYLVTDLIHLAPRSHIPLWFDAIMLGWFAATGLVLAATSLSGVFELLEARLGTVISSTMVTIAGVLSGFGVYLGRFERWNSWDVVNHPMLVAADVLHRFAHPEQHSSTWAMAAVIGLVVLASFLALRSGPRASRTALSG